MRMLRDVPPLLAAKRRHEVARGVSLWIGKRGEAKPRSGDTGRPGNGLDVARGSRVAASRLETRWETQVLGLPPQAIACRRSAAVNGSFIREVTRLAQGGILSFALVCALFLALATTPTYAARLVHISIELDGKTVLSGHSSDDGFETPYIVWRHLKNAPLEPEAQLQLEPVPGETGKAVLRGKIAVDVQYGARIETDELPFTQVLGKWHVDPAWVEANGPPGNLVDEQRKTDELRREVFRRDFKNPFRILLLGGLGLLGVLVAILVLVLAVSWRRSAASRKGEPA